MNHLIFHSIKFKLIFFITAVIAVISIFVYTYFPNKFEKIQFAAIEDKANSLAQIASYSVGPAIYFDDIEAGVEQIAPLLKSGDIEYIVIHLQNDSIFYQFDLPLASKQDYINCSIVPISTDNLTLRLKTQVEFENNIIGTLYMGYSLKDLKAEVRTIKSNIGVVSLIIFTVGLLSIIYIGFIVTRPLTIMVGVVEKIREGNLAIRAPIIKHDEIGYLAKSFNSMVDRIENTNEELETINKNLENRVVERTEELSKSKEKAESAVKMKTEFLAQMSHEIRTPINSILSYTQLLKDETLDLIPKDLQFSFDMINNGGRRLIRTVDLILNMSEMQTGTYETIIEECNIVNLLDELVGEFQTAAKSKHLALMMLNRLDVEDSVLKTDIYTVTQIFANLIDNAIKYTVEGSIEVTAFKTTDNHLCVDVQDTGIGISQKFQETLFEPFTQEEQGYTRKFDGNGLGMALVKEYCKLNNAQISVSSIKGEGTTFSVIFPQNSKISTSKEHEMATTV